MPHDVDTASGAAGALDPVPGEGGYTVTVPALPGVVTQGRPSSSAASGCGKWGRSSGLS